MRKINHLLALTLIFLSLNLFSQSNKKETMVLIKTTKGNITIKLYNETPQHRDNFIKLVKEKFYDGVLFHRVIKDFMVQCGDPESVGAAANAQLGSGGPGYTIPAEINPKFIHKKGALAAARTADQINPKRESSGSQFYIVQGNKYNDAQLDNFEMRMRTKFSKEQRDAYKSVGGTPHLDGAYTVFGEVVKGIEVVDAIAAEKTGRNDRPEVDVKIISMEIVK